MKGDENQDESNSVAADLISTLTVTVQFFIFGCHGFGRYLNEYTCASRPCTVPSCFLRHYSSRR